MSMTAGLAGRREVWPRRKLSIDMCALRNMAKIVMAHQQADQQATCGGALDENEGF